MTRMWLTNPQELCRQHLLGEHKELHQLVGTINAKRDNIIQGHAKRGQIDTTKIRSRHTELAAEMARRGYNHNSPLPAFVDPGVGRVDVVANRLELFERCAECAARAGVVA